MTGNETAPKPIPCDACGAESGDIADQIIEPRIDHIVSDGMVVMHVPVPVRLCQDCQVRWELAKGTAFRSFLLQQSAMAELGHRAVERMVERAVPLAPVPLEKPPGMEEEDHDAEWGGSPKV